MRYRIMRLDDYGWQLVIDAEASLSVAFSIAEHASEHPTKTEARVEHSLTQDVVAVYRHGLCVQLHGRRFP